MTWLILRRTVGCRLVTCETQAHIESTGSSISRRINVLPGVRMSVLRLNLNLVQFEVSHLEYRRCPKRALYSTRRQTTNINDENVPVKTPHHCSILQLVR